MANDSYYHDYSTGSQQYRAYNTPAGNSDDEEAMSTNAPVFNYPTAQNKQRRLPTISGMENQLSEYPSPKTAVRANNYNAPFAGIHRPYAPPSPSPRSPTEQRQPYVEHPVFNPGRSGYDAPVNSSTRESNYSTHSLPPVSMPYRRTVGPSLVRMPPGVVGSIYEQQNTPNPEFNAPRGLVIQSQSGNIPLDSDSDDDLRYAVV